MQFDITITLMSAISLPTIYLIFNAIENSTDADEKLKMGYWLLESKRFLQNKAGWIKGYLNFFERIFGKKHFSWFCFKRSILTSLTVFIFLMLTLVVIGNISITEAVPQEDSEISENNLDSSEDISNTDFEDDFFKTYDTEDEEIDFPESLGLPLNNAEANNDYTIVFVIIFITIFLNVCGDYLSLYVTRRVLNKIPSSNIIGLCAFLIIDLLLSLVVILGTIYVCFLIIHILPIDDFDLLFDSPFSDDKDHGEFLNSINSVFTAILLSIVMAPIAFIGDRLNFSSIILLVPIVSIATSLLTSIWLWLYVFSGISLKLFSPLLKFGLNFFDISESPYRSMGTFLITLLFIFNIFYSGLSYLF